MCCILIHGILIHVIKILTHDPCPKVEKYVCLFFVILVFFQYILFNFTLSTAKLPPPPPPENGGIMKLSPYPRDATHRYMYLINTCI